MSFQHSSQGPPGVGGDVQSRRNILQGLQQTKNRLQRLHSDEPTMTRLSPGHHLSGHRPMGRSPHHKPTPSPNEQTALHQQQKAAMQQAHSQSFGYFIPQASYNRNFILPVLPRFTVNGELANS